MTDLENKREEVNETVTLTDQLSTQSAKSRRHSTVQLSYADLIKIPDLDNHELQKLPFTRNLVDPSMPRTTLVSEEPVQAHYIHCPKRIPPYKRFCQLVDKLRDELLDHAACDVQSSVSESFEPFCMKTSNEDVIKPVFMQTRSQNEPLNNKNVGNLWDKLFQKLEQHQLEEDQKNIVKYESTLNKDNNHDIEPVYEPEKEKKNLFDEDVPRHAKGSSKHRHPSLSKDSSPSKPASQSNSRASKHPARHIKRSSSEDSLPNNSKRKHEPSKKPSDKDIPRKYNSSSKRQHRSLSKDSSSSQSSTSNPASQSNSRASKHSSNHQKRSSSEDSHPKGSKRKNKPSKKASDEDVHQKSNSSSKSRHRSLSADSSSSYSSTSRPASRSNSRASKHLSNHQKRSSSEDSHPKGSKRKHKPSKKASDENVSRHAKSLSKHRHRSLSTDSSSSQSSSSKSASPSNSKKSKHPSRQKKRSSYEDGLPNNFKREPYAKQSKKIDSHRAHPSNLPPLNLRGVCSTNDCHDAPIISRFVLPLSVPSSPRVESGILKRNRSRSSSLVGAPIGSKRPFTSRLPSTRSRFLELFQPTPSALVSNYLNPLRYPSVEELRSTAPLILQPAVMPFRQNADGDKMSELELQLDYLVRKTESILASLDELKNGESKTSTFERKTLDDVLDAQEILRKSEAVLRNIQNISTRSLPQRRHENTYLPLVSPRSAAPVLQSLLMPSQNMIQMKSFTPSKLGGAREYMKSLILARRKLVQTTRSYDAVPVTLKYIRPFRWNDNMSGGAKRLLNNPLTFGNVIYEAETPMMFPNPQRRVCFQHVPF